MLAIEGFARRRNAIRTPSIVYVTVLLTILPIVLAEQYAGEHRTDRPLLVTAVYSPYVFMPLVLLWRVWRTDVFSGPDTATMTAPARRQRAKAAVAAPKHATADTGAGAPAEQQAATGRAGRSPTRRRRA